jgi:hypothetical protein
LARGRGSESFRLARSLTSILLRGRPKKRVKLARVDRLGLTSGRMRRAAYTQTVRPREAVRLDFSGLEHLARRTSPFTTSLPPSSSAMGTGTSRTLQRFPAPMAKEKARKRRWKVFGRPSHSFLRIVVRMRCAAPHPMLRAKPSRSSEAHGACAAPAEARVLSKARGSISFPVVQSSDQCSGSGSAPYRGRGQASAKDLPQSLDSGDGQAAYRLPRAVRGTRDLGGGAVRDRGSR